MSADFTSPTTSKSSQPQTTPEKTIDGPRKTKRLYRRRLLKRGCRYEPFTADHIKYLWAAYVRGQFPHAQTGLTAEEFREFICAWIAQFIETGGDWYALIAQTRYGEIPVGVISEKQEQGPETVLQLIPHAVWFPEASPRNKLECIVRFLTDRRKEGNVMTVAREVDWRFFGQVCNYGVLRPVGKLRGHYADGSDATLYQGVR